MALINCQNVHIAFGSRPLLEDASLQIHRGEKIGLLGRNGEGKSTLLRLIAGELEPDRGKIVRDERRHVAKLSQQVPAGIEHTVDAIIRAVVINGNHREHR